MWPLQGAIVGVHGVNTRFMLAIRFDYFAVSDVSRILLKEHFHGHDQLDDCRSISGAIPAYIQFAAAFGNGDGGLR
jgi:hypothetical protein